MANSGQPSKAARWLLAFVLVACSSAPGFQARDGEQPDQRTAALTQLTQLEKGIAPLFVLGDVNEDGRVDARDATLIDQLAAGQSPAAATCTAAADFNMDGKIDSADVELMRRMLNNGGISVPALHFQYRLPCSFKRLLLAARPAVTAGEPNLVYFLDRRFNTENSKVEIPAGDATVTAMPSHAGYVIASSKPDTQSGRITVLITVGPNAGGGRYYYTYSFGLPPESATQ